jgi:hypothetical protein
MESFHVLAGLPLGTVKWFLKCTRLNQNQNNLTMFSRPYKHGIVRLIEIGNILGTMLLAATRTWRNVNKPSYFFFNSPKTEFREFVNTYVLKSFFNLKRLNIYNPINLNCFEDLYKSLQPNSGLRSSKELSVSLQLLDLGQSVGLLRRVISSSLGLYLYTNTEKRTHNTDTKHPCPEWDSNPRSRRSRERNKFIP